MTRTIVVGAGSAGCVVAATLSSSPDHEVVLVEAGHDRSPTDRPASLRVHDWTSALTEPGALWSDLVATRTPDQPPTPYARGRGVGGSASVNGMLALPGRPHDYDRWAEDLGCRGWGWRDVRPTFERLKGDLVRVAPSQLGTLDTAVLRAARDLGLPSGTDPFEDVDGVGRAWVTADQHGRRSSAEVWLDSARRRPNLRVHGTHAVERLLVDAGRTAGVRLDSGEELESDRVVLCAGAIGSPVVLLRSGLDGPHVGAGLRDHPSASLGLVSPLLREATPRFPIGVVLRSSSSVAGGDLQVLPLHRPDPVGRADARVLAAVMAVRASGRVALDRERPWAPPSIELNLLDHPTDRRAAADAAALLVGLLQTPPLRAVVEDVLLPPGLAELEDLLDPRAAVAWMAAAPGGHVHACGTCRMGPPDDPRRVVDLDGSVHGLAGAYVMDASVLPDIPAAGTHLPTVMVAERLSSRLASRPQSER